MSDKVIALSYAHYPEAHGASFNGFSEHYESIAWTMMIKNVLIAHGYKVVIAPVGRLGNKVVWINTHKPEVAVEVHFNGCVNPNVNGCETLYYPKSKNGKKLANIIQKSLQPEMGNTDRGIKEGWYLMDVPEQVDWVGDVEGDEKVDYFLRKTCCPAVIVEPDFISQIQTITEKRCGGATMIALGIIKYLES